MMIGCTLFFFSSHTYLHHLQQITLLVPVRELTNQSKSLLTSIIFHPAVTTRLSQAGEQVNFAVATQQMAILARLFPQVRGQPTPEAVSQPFCPPLIPSSPPFSPVSITCQLHLPSPSSIHSTSSHIWCMYLLFSFCSFVLFITYVAFTSLTTHTIISFFSDT